MKNQLPTLFVCLLLCLGSSFGLAQDTVQLDDREKPILAEKNLSEKLQSNNNISTTSSVSNLASISLVSLFSDTQAEAKFSVKARESLFNIGLSQSFSQKPQTATFLDRDGITTGTTFSIAWQRTIGKTLIRGSAPIADIKKYIEVKEKVRSRKQIDPASDVTYLDMDPADRKELIEAGAINLDNFATPLILTARFSASRAAFNYIPDSTAARPSETTRVGQNFNLALSKFTSLYTYFAFSYSLVVNYLSGSDVLNYTFPVGTSGHAFTSEVTLGEPVRAVDSRVRAELRQMVTKNKVPVLGVNPSVTWLVKSEKLNIDLPVYFITKREDGEFNGLQAGMKIGYTSRFDDHFLGDMFNFKSPKLYFGLFVTKPFSVKN